MGKGGKRSQLRGKRGGNSNRPHPALIGAVLVAATLVALQTAGVDLKGWFPKSTSLGTSQSDVLRFREFTERENRGDTISREEADWLYSKAMAVDLSTKLPTQPLVGNAIGAHQLAAWAAVQVGMDERKLELCFRLATLLEMVDNDEQRRGLYSNIVSRFLVPFQDHVEKNAIPLLSQLLEAAFRKGDYTSLSSMYTDRAMAIHMASGLDAAIESLDECFERGRANSEVIITNCRHGRALLQLWSGNVKDAMTMYLAAHDDRLTEFRAPPNGRRCHATEHRLVLETTTATERASTPHLTIHTQAPALDQKLQALPPLECTSQEWPLFLLSPSAADWPSSLYTSGKTVGHSAEGAWKIAEWQDSPMERIRCVRDGDKVLRLYVLEDVYVHGIFKTVSTSDCHVIQTGFAYCSSFSRPHILPDKFVVQEVEEVVMLPAMERNYFHMTIEGSQQILFPQLFDVVNGRRLPILIAPQEVSAGVTRILGVAVSDLVAFDDKDTAYHVNKLFVSDWVYPEVDPDTEERHHTEEYYVPPQSHLRFLRKELMRNVKLGELDRSVVVLNRTAGLGHARTIVEFDTFLDTVRTAATRYGLKVLVHSGSLPLEEQIRMFHSAELVIGSHGAGLTNIIYCQPGAAMIELPSFPRKPSVYSMMSSALGLDVWTLPSADAYRFGAYRMNERNIRLLKFTVDYILHSKGYEPLPSQGEWPAWQ